MQISTHEMLKLLAENTRKAEEQIIAKLKKEEKPKRYIVKVEVRYELYDVEKDMSSFSYNIVMGDQCMSAIKMVINDLHIKFFPEDIYIEYNPVTLVYECYKRFGEDQRVLVYEIRNVRDMIVGREEI